MNSNTIFIDNYIGLIDNLEPKYKLEIIEKISKSLRSRKKITERKSTFGAFVSKKPAEEIIEDLRSARKFNRIIETF
jgi:hypothetical protein